RILSDPLKSQYLAASLAGRTALRRRRSSKQSSNRIGAAGYFPPIAAGSIDGTLSTLGSVRGSPLLTVKSSSSLIFKDMNTEVAGVGPTSRQRGSLEYHEPKELTASLLRARNCRDARVRPDSHLGIRQARRLAERVHALHRD